MSSNGADMQAIRNRWLKKRKSQMAKWLNGFKPKPPKTRSKSDENGQIADWNIKKVNRYIDGDWK